MDDNDKYGGRYTGTIYLRAKHSEKGTLDYFMGRYTSPRSLRLALSLMRVMNPNREYITNDPNNP